MRRPFLSLVALSVALSLFVLGCTQAAPAPAPTSAPAAPKAAEPAKAAAPAAPTAAPAAAPAAAAPTAAPAPKVNFPEKGKTITYIVPFAPGGSTDITARLMAPYMEKDLGVSFAIQNKPGGDTQVAMTELVKSKPDGYTIGTVDIYACILTYLQPERQTIYTRKDFANARMFYNIPAVFAVPADSPFKSVKDLVDAAKAKPETIKIGDTGAMGPYHLANLLFEKMAGIKVNTVHFSGAGPTLTAVLGGHVDAGMVSVTSANSAVKNGQARILGVTDHKRTTFFPDAPTFEEQGYENYMTTYYTVAAPAGTPKEILDILGQAVVKAQANPDFLKKANEQSLVPSAATMGPAEVDAYWEQAEKDMKEMLALAQQENK